MLAEGIAQADLLVWGPTDTVTTLTWFEGDPETVSTVVDAVETLTAAQLVAGDGGTYAFLHQTDFEFGAAVMDLVADARVAFVPPVRFREKRVVRFEAVGDREGLAAFHDRLTDDFDADLESVREFRRWGSASALTDRQREALAAAVAVGYYDHPRTGSVADVAAELDCAHSTAGELLRRAESAVCRAAVEPR
jgi:predicted DNA binding protein